MTKFPEKQVWKHERIHEQQNFPLPDSIYQLCCPDWSHDHWDKGDHRLIVLNLSLLGCHDNGSYPPRVPETPTESPPPPPPQVFNKKEFENIAKAWASRRFQVGGLSVKVGGEQEEKMQTRNVELLPQDTSSIIAEFRLLNRIQQLSGSIYGAAETFTQI